MLCFQADYITFLSGENKDKILQRRKYKSIYGYCIKPIVSLQLTSFH
jgi:hypothetical protein